MKKLFLAVLIIGLTVLHNSGISESGKLVKNHFSKPFNIYLKGFVPDKNSFSYELCYPIDQERACPGTHKGRTITSISVKMPLDEIKRCLKTPPQQRSKRCRMLVPDTSLTLEQLQSMLKESSYLLKGSFKNETVPLGKLFILHLKGIDSKVVDDLNSSEIKVSPDELSKDKIIYLLTLLKPAK
jgi:hypothetical protein